MARPKYSPTGGISPKSSPNGFFRSYQPNSVLHQHVNGHPLSSGPGLPRPIRRPRKILYLIVVLFLLYWFGVRHGLGIERIPLPPLGFAVSGGRRGRRSSLFFGELGMATVAPAPGLRTWHPIYELMERAETRWTTLYLLLNLPPSPPPSQSTRNVTVSHHQPVSKNGSISAGHMGSA